MWEMFTSHYGKFSSAKYVPKFNQTQNRPHFVKDDKNMVPFYVCDSN